MGPIRKRHSAAFKAKVALEAAKPNKTISELAKPHQVHPVPISQWKKQLLDGLEGLFENASSSRRPDHEKLQTQLYEQIGRLQMELAWVKKNLPREVEAKNALIESTHPRLSVRRQCELLGLDRSSFDYEPATKSLENLRLMRRIDEQYLKTPFYGSRRMTAWLLRQGEEVNCKRVSRLLALMGLETIDPGPRTTTRNADHKVYPYLLRDMASLRLVRFQPLPYTIFRLKCPRRGCKVWNPNVWDPPRIKADSCLLPSWHSCRLRRSLPEHSPAAPLR